VSGGAGGGPGRGGSFVGRVGSSHFGIAFWSLGILGWAAIGYATWGVIVHPGATDPPNFAVWFLGAAVVHDLVVAPVVLVVGLALVRTVRRGRAALQVAIICSATLCLFSLPVLLGLGGLRDNATLLPRNETLGLVAALAVVWATTAAVVLGRRRSANRRSPPGREASGEGSGA
jgi:hypothetical protein